jgi:peptidyl-prolyl cis-trans isomerase C
MNQRFLVAVVIALAVTSCQRKAEGQTVAVVNGEEITAADLNAELSNGTSTLTDTSKDTRSKALQLLIDRRLLAQQAKSDGLDKSPAFLNQQRKMTEDLLINMLVSRQVNTAQLPSADEINRFEASKPEMFANREIWTLQQILYSKPKDAAVTAKIDAANSLDEIAQILTASGVQFTRATRQIDTGSFPHNIYEQVYALKQGEPFIAPGPEKAIASVITDRQPMALSGDKAREFAVAALRRLQMENVVQDRVKTLKGSAKIQYQPGFEPPKN